MPIHEYQCDACGHRFERIQKFSDPPVEICPNCGKPAVKKLISSPAFQFKGTGWYVTDYAKKDSGGGKAAGNKDNGDTAAKAAAKTDSSSSGSGTTSSTSASDASTSPAKPADKN